MRSRQDIVLLVVAALVVVLAVIAAVAGGRGAPAPDPSTPEGVVQQYVTAVVEADQAAMAALLDPALGCEPPFYYGSATASASLAVVSTRIDGDRATVVVEITEGGGGPLPGGRYTHRESFDLVASGDSWLVTGMPWPVYECKVD